MEKYLPEQASPDAMNHLFRLDDENQLFVDLEHRNSLSEFQDSVTDFAKECIPALCQSTISGPLIISGLPADFSTALALAAWFCGYPVAFIDPDLGTTQQQSIVNSLQPSLWVTSKPPSIKIPLCTNMLDLGTEQGEEDFEEWQRVYPS